MEKNSLQYCLPESEKRVLSDNQNWCSQSVRAHVFGHCDFDRNHFEGLAIGLAIRLAIIYDWENNVLIIDNGKVMICINLRVKTLNYSMYFS